MTVSPVVRTALFVRDLERSTRFWRALGFHSAYFEGDLDPASVSATLRLPEGATCRCRILKRDHDDPNFGMVGLFEIGGAPLDHIARHHTSPHIGEAALVLYTDDLDASIAAARTHEALDVWEPVLFTMPHRSQRECCLRDPDGVLINLVERDPSEANKKEPVTAG
jgi:catechol 2,3-dioxygenase-like lactoylglutathione lyase family enzyme